MTDPIYIALALAPVAFFGAMMFAITGFGSSLVTIPLATHFLPLPFALAVFSIVDLLNALRLGVQNTRHAVKSEALRMVPLILAGLVVGVTLLVNLPRKAGMAALGVFVFLYAVYALAYRASDRIVGQGWSYAAGLSGGILGALFGAGGAPYAIYLSHRPVTKDQYRATLTVIAIFSIALRTLIFAVTGLLAQDGLWIAVAGAVPGGFLGLAVGSRVFGRISRERLMKIIAVALLATGMSLIVRAAA